MTEKFRCPCGNIINIDTTKNAPSSVICWKCGTAGSKVKVHVPTK